MLDPFLGGGVMLLEASRLGASVRGVDIEPVAAAVARFQTKLRDLPDLGAHLEQLIESVGSALAPYYRAEDADGRPETLLHAFWVQQVRCSGCGFTFDAHPKFRLAWSEPERSMGSMRRVQLDHRGSPGCCDGGVPVRCRDPEHGRPHRSRKRLLPSLRWARAPHRVWSPDGVPPKFRLFAVETLPAGDTRRVAIRDRRIRSATEFDKDRFREAETRLGEVLAEDPDALPSGLMPRTGRADDRLVAYGYRDYVEMFNPRQRLHLASLGAAIEKVEGDARDGLAVAFSDHLTTNTMLCAYAGGWRRLAPLFAIRAYRHIARLWS